MSAATTAAGPVITGLVEDFLAATMVIARQRAINAAAMLWAGDDLPPYAKDEFVRGQVETIADAFGGNPDLDEDAKDTVWAEINAKVVEDNRRVTEAAAARD